MKNLAIKPLKQTQMLLVGFAALLITVPHLASAQSLDADDGQVVDAPAAGVPAKPKPQFKHMHKPQDGASHHPHGGPVTPVTVVEPAHPAAPLVIEDHGRDRAHPVVVEHPAAPLVIHDPGHDRVRPVVVEHPVVVVHHAHPAPVIVANAPMWIDEQGRAPIAAPQPPPMIADQGFNQAPPPASAPAPMKMATRVQAPAAPAPVAPAKYDSRVAAPVEAPTKMAARVAAPVAPAAPAAVDPAAAIPTKYSSRVAAPVDPAPEAAPVQAPTKMAARVAAPVAPAAPAAIDPAAAIPTKYSSRVSAPVEAAPEAAPVQAPTKMAARVAAPVAPAAPAAIDPAAAIPTKYSSRVSAPVEAAPEAAPVQAPTKMAARVAAPVAPAAPAAIDPAAAIPTKYASRVASPVQPVSPTDAPPAEAAPNLMAPAAPQAAPSKYASRTAAEPSAEVAPGKYSSRVAQPVSPMTDQTMRAEIALAPANGPAACQPAIQPQTGLQQATDLRDTLNRRFAQNGSSKNPLIWDKGDDYDAEDLNRASENETEPKFLHKQVEGTQSSAFVKRLLKYAGVEVNRDERNGIHRKRPNQSLRACGQGVRMAFEEAAGQSVGKLWTRNAKDMGPFIAKYGYKKVSPTQMSPEKAPLGSVMIYDVPGQPRMAGHIEIKGINGYYSDFFESKPISEKTNKRRLIAIYVPPQS